MSIPVFIDLKFVEFKLTCHILASALKSRYLAQLFSAMLADILSDRARRRTA